MRRLFAIVNEGRLTRYLKNSGKVLAGCFILDVAVAFGQGPSDTLGRPIGAEHLLGEWVPTYRGDSPCITSSFTIVSAGAGRDLKALEIRKCASIKYALNYDVNFSLQSGRVLIALAPLAQSDGANAVEVIEPLGGRSTYSPDRLTLWLSADACELDGWRKDRARNAFGVSFRKHVCP